MPSNRKRPCLRPGCRVLVDRGYCPGHAHVAQAREAKRQAAIDAKRESSSARGYDSAWRAVRRQFLEAHPLCVGYGQREGQCHNRATEVDHRVSIEQAPHLRLNWSNLRPYCKACHSARTATEQAFGRGENSNGRATAIGVPKGGG